MEFGQLEAFERAARDGSFTRAAEALGLTQPAVSMRVTALEAALGAPLFERQGRRLALTPLGEHLLPYARRVLNAIDETQQAAQGFQRGQRGQVKIAAPTPFVLSLLVPTLAHFRDQHPAVDILIRERNKTTIYNMLHDRAVTLGLVNAPVSAKDVTVLARFQDPIRAVVGAEHPLAAHSSALPMEAVYGHTIFRVSMFPRMTVFIDTLVENARQGSGGAVIKVPMVMAQQLVRMGKGVTFLPQSYVDALVNRGDLVYLDLDDMPRLMSQPVLISRKSQGLDDVHQEFARILKATLRPLSVS